MTQQDILKMAGVKTPKELYTKYPTHESFMAKYGKQIKKALNGSQDPPYGFNSDYQDPEALPPREYTPIKPMPVRGAGPLEVPALKNAKLAPITSNKSSDFLDNITSNDVAGKIAGGIEKIIAEKKAKDAAQQWNQVSSLQLQASATKDIDANQQLADNMTKKRQMMMPVNTGEEFFPIYGVGTNPLAKDGKKVKGKKAMTGATANMLSQGFDKITPTIYGDNGGSDLGGTLGKTTGDLIGGPVGGLIGKQLGQLAGFVLDRNPSQIKKANDSTMRNSNMMAFNNISHSNSYMEDGGKSNWNPQILNSFGDYKLKSLLESDETMNTLRAGGNLRDYINPSERSLDTGLDGLQTHWGGYAEPISTNPYSDSPTVMFKGQSHDDTDSKGNSGIGMTYGNNPIEVEGKEPAQEFNDGDGKNLVVFGNLPITKQHANLLGDPSASGKKYKNYIADLSKKEVTQTNTIDNSTNVINGLNPRTPFERLTFTSHVANMQGANMTLANIAEKKENAAALQQAVNDTAEEHGLVADDLAKGNIKKAKEGIKVNTDINRYSEMPQRLTYKHGTNDDTMYDLQGNPINTPVDNTYSLKDYTDIPNTNQSFSDIDENPQIKKPTWMGAINSMIPYLRPTNAEQLDPRQISGEMFALSQNQQEPVSLQTYKPELSTPYDISQQDTLNENQATFRGAQRMIGYNPAGQANLAAQQYQANERVLGEQFRENQGMKNQTYAQNRQLLNQAQEHNLQAYDQQATRQSQAKSNTKEVAQAALNSISDKFLKNKLSNRTLQTYENMYNYRYSPNMRTENWNGAHEFNIPTVGSQQGIGTVPGSIMGANGKPLYPQYKKGVLTYVPEDQATFDEPIPITTDKKVKKSGRNGSIVSAYKNI